MPRKEHPDNEDGACAWREALARRLPDLGSDACDVLAGQAHRQLLRRGQALLRPGDAWSCMHWVARGALRLYYVDAGGIESNKNFHLEDALLWPITPHLRTQPVSFHVEAMENSVVWRLDMASFEAVAAPLASWTQLRLQTLSALLEDKMQRERSFLLEDRRQRYEALRHLASYLGMTDVSLSRLRARMGLIRG